MYRQTLHRASKCCGENGVEAPLQSAEMPQNYCYCAGAVVAGGTGITCSCVAGAVSVAAGGGTTCSLVVPVVPGATVAGLSDPANEKNAINPSKAAMARPISQPVEPPVLVR